MTAFDHDVFNAAATQLRNFAHDYAALGLASDQAAGWANHGFTPDEAVPWLDEGHTPERASHWGGQRKSISPADARKRDER